MFAAPETIDLSRSFYWKKESLDEFIDFIGKDKHYARVLDAGCGIGFLTTVLADNLDLDNIVGLDINPASIEIANQRKEQSEQGDKITYQVGDLLSLDDKDPFDLVFAHFFLIDTQNADDVLAHLFRLTQPGGVLCCIEPIYQTDLLNCYLPFLSDKDRAKMRHISWRMTVEIPQLVGIDRTIATSMPKRFNDLGLKHIKIKVHGNYSFSYDYDQQTLNMMQQQGQQTLAQLEAIKQMLEQHPLFKNLSASEVDDFMETQFKLSELIVENPQKVAQMGLFTVGFSLMIRGNK